MDWLSMIGNTVTSAAGGGVFGLVGSLTGGVIKYFQTKQQQKFEKEKWDHELALLDIELKRESMEDEHELAVISQQGAWQGLATSITADSGVGDSYKWVNAIKALYRPVLTSGLVLIAFLIFKDLSAMLADAENSSALSAVLTPAQAKDLLIYTVNSLVFSASTAVVWWFGDRAFAPPGMKNR